MGEFDACWSTVIAAADTHAAFGDAPDNGWVQRCRLESGHPGLHGSDAGAKPVTGRRLWLQWVDEVSGHRLIELSPCPGTDGADSACALFADHGGPHRFVPTSSTLTFGTHYQSETTVSRNGSSRGGSVATARGSVAPAPPQRHATEQPRVSVPESVGEQVSTGRRSRHLDDTQQESDDQTSQTSPPSAPGTARTRRAADRAAEAVPTVDEALLAVAEALAALARAIRRRDDTV
ncbi:hypothetical protein [Williamsia soli]|uniref:hypothetical protein n=1 Tax=Williamsia soli TaxID=364929 RepID=UPI001A9F8603|nr:hypothetical protein [Williamsia soli]